MKTSLLALILLGLASFRFSGTEKEITYSIDKNKSKVEWRGYYLFSFGEHYGSINIKDGTLNANANGVTSGKITIDMTTIRSLEVGPNENDDLGNHLKSVDFFDVDKFGTSTFEISKISPAEDPGNGPKFEVTGYLTMKGIRNEVRFPADVTMNGKTVTAKAKFKIDRTKWNVRYNSGKYFSDVGDGAISDAIGISFDIIAIQQP